MDNRLLLALALLLVTGCSRTNTHHAEVPRLPEPTAPRRTLETAEPANAGRSAGGYEFSDEEMVAKTSSRRTIAVVQGSMQLASAPASPQPATLPKPAEHVAPHEMLDIEARFAIECEKPSAAASKLRDVVRARGGQITLDESHMGTHASEATLEVRIPSSDLDKLFEDLGTLGQIRNREVKARDVGKEYHDAQLLLSNLEAALQRYEQLLAKASTVPEVVAIERELERLRARIDRVKGDLAWLKDRVARATVRVRLFPTGTSEEPALSNQSSFFPSLRATTLFDLRGESDRYGYLGGGLAFGIHGPKGGPRAFVVEFDIARAAFTDRPPDSNYAYLALGGIDLYSDLLGGGRRRFLNPYLGFRAGYAHSEGSGDMAAGGLLGVDLLKTQNVIVELSFRGLAMFGSDRGAHVMLGPTLGVDFAF